MTCTLASPSLSVQIGLVQRTTACTGTELGTCDRVSSINR
jgi:hypothetical protein